MGRRAELESQIAALREANALLEERITTQARTIADLDRAASSAKSQQVTAGDLLQTTGPALLAIARMIEDRAATMAIAKGCDVAEYHRLIQHAHQLRVAIGDDHTQYEDEAAALFDELTEPALARFRATRGLTSVDSSDAIDAARNPRA